MFVHCLCLSPDGSVFASSEGRGMSLWSRDQKRMLATAYHPLPCRGLAFVHADLILSACDDGRIRLWRAGEHTLTVLRSSSLGAGHQGGMNAVAWCQALCVAATAGCDGKVILWSLKSMKPMHIVDRQSGPVVSLAWSLDGILAFAGEDASVSVFYARTTALIVLRGHSQDNDACSCDHSGGLQDYNASCPVQGHFGPVHSLAFSPSGNTVVSGGQDGVVKVWGVEEWTREWHMLVHFTRHMGPIFSVTFCGDDRTVAVTGASGSVDVWDIWDTELLRVVAGHVPGLCVVHSDGALVTSSADGGIRTIAHPDAFCPGEIKPDIAVVAHTALRVQEAHAAIRGEDEVASWLMTVQA